MKYSSIKSFTLIELLIVIVIIGILAVALMPRILGMQDRARYVKVGKDMETFRNTVFLAQINTNKSLAKITDEICTELTCRTAWLNMKTLSSSHPCRTTWLTSLRKIEVAAWLTSGTLASMNTDPRGSPYLLDENEGEFDAPGVIDCRLDTIHSVWPDWLRTNLDTQDARNTSGDNRWINIASSYCPGAY